MLSLDAEVGARVEHLAADVLGEEEPQPVFQPVLKHIADNQSDKERESEITVPLLEEKRRQRGHHHGGTCGKAVEDLLDEEGVLSFAGAEVEVALGKFLQQTGTKNKVLVALGVVGMDGEVALSLLVGFLGQQHFLESRFQRVVVIRKRLVHVVAQTVGVFFEDVAQKLVGIGEILDDFTFYCAVFQLVI